MLESASTYVTDNLVQEPAAISLLRRYSYSYIVFIAVYELEAKPSYLALLHAL